MQSAVRLLLWTSTTCAISEEHLHADLRLPFPLQWGVVRTFRRRATGNITGLTEDCWALGYSAAQSAC